MKMYKGSFTVEAAYILPFIFACICMVIELGISFHAEIHAEVEQQSISEPLDVIKCMYRKAYVEELFGEFYEY